VLQSFQEAPPDRVAPDKLERAADQAERASSALQRLQAVLGDGDRAATEKDVAAASSEVDLVLQKCQATVDDWQSDLDAANQKLPRLTGDLLGWLTPGAILVTALCAWVAVSQISLSVHAWGWLRGPRASGGR
jgi:hypothetical protein